MSDIRYVLNRDEDSSVFVTRLEPDTSRGEMDLFVTDSHGHEIIIASLNSKGVLVIRQDSNFAAVEQEEEEGYEYDFIPVEYDLPEEIDQ